MIINGSISIIILGNFDCSVMIQIVHLFNNGDLDGSRFCESNVTVAFLQLAIDVQH